MPTVQNTSTPFKDRGDTSFDTASVTFGGLGAASLTVSGWLSALPSTVNRTL